jgi:signal transduction histidine kinase
MVVFGSVASGLAAEYARALERYVRSGSAADLTAGAGVGEKARRQNLPLPEVSRMHHEAVGEAVARAEAGCPVERVLRRSSRFLEAVLNPYQTDLDASSESAGVLRELNDRLEDEIRRIAHALHDEAGQILATFHFQLDEMVRMLPCDANGEQIRRLAQPVEEIEEQIRRLSHELRPTILDDLGLVPAVEFLATGIGRRRGIAVTVSGSTGGRLTSTVETALYRFIQEALNNAGKHAQAQTVAVIFERREGVFSCTIADDGAGFDPAAALRRDGRGGLGLLGMRETATRLNGQLSIDSTPGEGARITLKIPV